MKPAPEIIGQAEWRILQMLVEAGAEDISCIANTLFRGDGRSNHDQNLTGLKMSLKKLLKNEWVELELSRDFPLSRRTLLDSDVTQALDLGNNLQWRDDWNGFSWNSPWPSFDQVEVVLSERGRNLLNS